HDADVLPVSWIESLLEEVERSLRVLAGLHVDAHEGAVFARALEDLVHDRDTQILRDVEAHRRQLDGDVRIRFTLVDAVEHVYVRLTRGTRLGLVLDALTEQVEGCGDAPRVEAADCGEGALERFAGDEAV